MKTSESAKRGARLAALALFYLGPSLVTAVEAGANPHPNFIFILADDMGYMDIGANNPSTFYETPHLDLLAQPGVRFTAGYAACSVCLPTRGSILTGKYPPRTGITDFIGGKKRGRLLPAPNAKGSKSTGPNSHPPLPTSPRP
jgi:arylsulfatase A-like enzyme